MSGAYSLAIGDVLEVLAGFNDCSFDALFCDPPYGLRFMNKAWDYDVPSVATWRECLRVLKPGAPLLAFGGARRGMRPQGRNFWRERAGRVRSLGEGLRLWRLA